MTLFWLDYHFRLIMDCIKFHLLHKYLDRLPYEMRPSKVIITTEDMPFTFNGKYDRLKIVKSVIEKKER